MSPKLTAKLSESIQSRFYFYSLFVQSPTNQFYNHQSFEHMAKSVPSMAEKKRKNDLRSTLSYSYISVCTHMCFQPGINEYCPFFRIVYERVNTENLLVWLFFVYIVCLFEIIMDWIWMMKIEEDSGMSLKNIFLILE